MTVLAAPSRQVRVAPSDAESFFEYVLEPTADAAKPARIFIVRH